MTFICFYNVTLTILNVKLEIKVVPRRQKSQTLTKKKTKIIRNEQKINGVWQYSIAKYFTDFQRNSFLTRFLGVSLPT